MAACEMGSVNLTGALWLAEAVASLHGAYAQLHPYVAVILCLAGTAMNIVTVVVLTRPSMQSPINWLLCAVAVCDIFVMSSVLIFVSHFLIAASSRCDIDDWNRGWAYFLFVHAQTTVIFHATSIWLTVLLAQIRVYTIKHATSTPTEPVSPRTTFYITLLTLGIVMVANIPNFLTFEIVERVADGFCGEVEESAETTYLYQVIASEEDCGLLKAAFWTNGILFKVVPCIMLTVSIVTLVRIIREVSQRRKALAQVMNKKRMPMDHTTPMLVAVLSIFLIAELPQGILHVCNAIFSKDTFYIQIYQPLGDFMDLLSLVNSAVNFIIYCAMSRKFRCVFLQLTLSCLPNHVYRRFVQNWSDLNVNEISQRKPGYSGYTADITTKTEQLALTSHRVSATSMLIAAPSKENMNNIKVYSGNFLSVDQPGSHCTLSTPRVSLTKQPFEARSSLEIHEMKIAVPQQMNRQNGRPRYEILASMRSWVERTFGSAPDTPQRRIQMLQCETSTAGY